MENQIKIEFIGIDGWDRVVFQGGNGRFYKTIELEPDGGYENLSREEQVDMLRTLHTTADPDGEPDFPCWKPGAFELVNGDCV